MVLLTNRGAGGKYCIVHVCPSSLGHSLGITWDHLTLFVLHFSSFLSQVLAIFFSVTTAEPIGRTRCVILDMTLANFQKQWPLFFMEEGKQVWTTITAE